jgi:hypothetical protein
VGKRRAKGEGKNAPQRYRIWLRRTGQTGMGHLRQRTMHFTIMFNETDSSQNPSGSTLPEGFFIARILFSDNDRVK